MIERTVNLQSPKIESAFLLLRIGCVTRMVMGPMMAFAVMVRCVMSMMMSALRMMT